VSVEVSAVLVITPTYQEADNIERFIAAVREVLPAAAILVVDDDSPDGTADLAERAGVQVLRRSAKLGLGSAYREALGLAVDMPFEGPDGAVVHMDADLSHDPLRIPSMLDALSRGADVVVGSRYVLGGDTVNWPVHRRLLSRWGNRYTASALSLPIHDVTSGFRAYTIDALKSIDAPATRSEGYAFLTELLMRCDDRGLRIEEVPISFVDRAYGQSKMSGRIIAESMLRVTAWGVSRRWRQLRSRLRPSR
jgi:dolichol-phosphate mannosyltransferase